MASSMQRRIQRLEEQAQQKYGKKEQAGLGRAAAELCVKIVYMDQDLSHEEREARIQEYMRPKPAPSPERRQKYQEMVDATVNFDDEAFYKAKAELDAMD